MLHVKYIPLFIVFCQDTVFNWLDQNKFLGLSKCLCYRSAPTVLEKRRNKPLPHVEATCTVDSILFTVQQSLEHRHCGDSPGWCSTHSGLYFREENRAMCLATGYAAKTVSLALMNDLSHGGHLWSWWFAGEPVTTLKTTQHQEIDTSSGEECVGLF